MLGSLGWWYPPNTAGAMKAASKTSAEANCPPLASIFFPLPPFFFFNDRNRSGDDNPALNPTHKLCLNGGGSSQRRALLCLRLFIHVFNSVDRWPVLTRCPVIYSGQAALNPTRNIMNSVNSAFLSPLMPLFFYFSRASFCWESNWILANSFVFVCPLLKKKRKNAVLHAAWHGTQSLTVLASLTRGFSRSESCTGLKTPCYIITGAAVDAFKLECRFKGAYWCFYWTTVVFSEEYWHDINLKRWN